MGRLSKEQQENADRLAAALEQRDQEQEDSEALQTAREMGDAARSGDQKKLNKLVAKAKRKGWVK